MRHLLYKAVEATSQRKWAMENGISQQAVSRALNGGNITPQIGKALGYRKVKMWVKK